MFEIFFFRPKFHTLYSSFFILKTNFPAIREEEEGLKYNVYQIFWRINITTIIAYGINLMN